MIKIDEIKKFEEDIISYRRYFHMYPETGFEEIKTSKKVIEVLEQLDIEVIKGIAETGVVGILKGKGEGKTIALRADMDALNMPEETDLEFKSKHKGKMHGCGHDAHTAMLLGAAKVLAENRDKINGTVKFIFQPAEEGPMPGGGKIMVESGVLDDVDACFAMHVACPLPIGTVAIHPREAMASADSFEITLIGKGGHGSMPQTSIDPIVMAGQVSSAFQGIISREIDPANAAVLSICTINGGTASNVIPEKVTMTGTVRTLSEEVREKIHERMEDIVKSITDMHKGTYELKITKGYPALINNPEMVDFTVDVCKNLIGEENIIKLDKPAMGGEDFAYYLNKRPGAFLLLGCGNVEKGICAPQHNPRFKVDEDALIIGTAIHTNFVINYLNQN